MLRRTFTARTAAAAVIMSQGPVNGEYGMLVDTTEAGPLAQLAKKGSTDFIYPVLGLIGAGMWIGGFIFKIDGNHTERGIVWNTARFVLRPKGY